MVARPRKIEYLPLDDIAPAAENPKGHDDAGIDDSIDRHGYIDAGVLLRGQSPGLRLVVSFADPTQGHRGGIYQAGNWIYTGQSSPVLEHFVGGRWRHVRGSYHEVKRRGAENVPTRQMPGKHRYLMPLDRAMRRRVERLRQPAPSAA